MTISLGRAAALATAAIAVSLAAAGAGAATVSFADGFTGAPSAQWGNDAGSWAVTAAGTYLATAPNNQPPAYSALPYDLTDFTLRFDALALADGGVFLRGDAGNRNGVLLVLGGNGYGNGNRGGTAGSSLYFHIIQDGVYSANQAERTGVFSPGQDYAISVAVSGDSYAASVNGSLVSTLTTSLFAHGAVALYDNQPNTTSAAGGGAPMAFDNFALNGTTAAGAVPEPATWALMAGGLGLAGAGLRRDRRRQRPCPA